VKGGQKVAKLNKSCVINRKNPDFSGLSLKSRQCPTLPRFSGRYGRPGNYGNIGTKTGLFLLFVIPGFPPGPIIPLIPTETRAKIIDV